MDPKTILLAALLGITVAFCVFWAVVERRSRTLGPASPGLWHIAIGFITNFFDTLGISSFATTTTFFRMPRRGRSADPPYDTGGLAEAPPYDKQGLVDDQVIPGTLNVGHFLPTVAQALIYITIVDVEFMTLALLILAAVGGSWIGAAIVAGLNRRAIQRGMGVALLIASVLVALSALGRLPGGGEAIGLEGPKLILAIGINFALGALMTLGIGLYAPCMIMISLLGMNPTAAFPVMMGSCAFLMPTAGIQFIKKAKYDLRASLGLALGGVPAVLIAAYIVRSLPLVYVRWLVVGVVLYTAVSLLRSAATSARASSR
jgi:uncharacterized membrane protein YfcA